ncbi:hypothetical protein J4212_04180 [Candidatus Woesearchaeota archaeon]|nr:hypothetical protein [Candidatus Woesearchaeota archaeon]
MTVVGFHFASVNAEKKEPIKGKVNINNNVAIKKVDEKELALGDGKHKALNFSFEFTSNYEPKIGGITLLGEIMFMEDSKKVKDILAGWKKNQSLPKDVAGRILNTVLNKCNVQALILADQVGLPPPIPLPKVKADN